ncbi:uncharacterized protein ARMOST_15218 [Armillaria ostoyae]|uniref:Uncharacterized protein n=1 Tax=Armillaria ostoyae TaxID=47428 RepID=A0A284RST7_ARMOS|nr:uncharacterized protein ARMOST_15218 [Armillaria ostoyae]
MLKQEIVPSHSKKLHSWQDKSNLSVDSYYVMIIRNLTWNRPIELVFTILQFTDPLGIVQFGQISYGAYEVVMAFTMSAHTTKKLILGFIPLDLIPEFQALQHNTRLIAFGSRALAFFTRKVLEDSNLNLLVNYRYLDEVVSFLDKTTFGPPVLLGVDNSMQTIDPTHAQFHL